MPIVPISANRMDLVSIRSLPSTFAAKNQTLKAFGWGLSAALDFRRRFEGRRSTYLAMESLGGRWHVGESHASV